MHLLVIEDERVLCETIVRSLRRLAYSVDHCYDGDKALELIQETLELTERDILIPFSAEKGSGKDELLRLLVDACRG